jgi:hypothetical protein
MTWKGCERGHRRTQDQTDHCCVIALNGIPSICPQDGQQHRNSATAFQIRPPSLFFDSIPKA